MDTEIAKLQAGRELDRLIGEKVMGCFVIERPRRDGRKLWDIFIPGGVNETDFAEEPKEPWKYYPHYSTDIAAAWQVVEKLSKLLKLTGERRIDCQQRRVFAVEFDGKDWCAGLKENDYDDGWEWWEWPAEAPTAPLAICRAALLMASAALASTPHCSRGIQADKPALPGRPSR